MIVHAVVRGLEEGAGVKRGLCQRLRKAEEAPCGGKDRQLIKYPAPASASALAHRVLYCLSL